MKSTSPRDVDGERTLPRAVRGVLRHQRVTTDAPGTAARIWASVLRTEIGKYSQPLELDQQKMREGRRPRQRFAAEASIPHIWSRAAGALAPDYLERDPNPLRRAAVTRSRTKLATTLTARRPLSREHGCRPARAERSSPAGVSQASRP
jgi:hypothetical protein